MSSLNQFCGGGTSDDIRQTGAGYWLIDTHNGYEGVPAIDVDEYPAIKEHLESYYPRLERRYDQDRTPYNLRKIALTAY